MWQVGKLVGHLRNIEANTGAKVGGVAMSAMPLRTNRYGGFAEG